MAEIPKSHRRINNLATQVFASSTTSKSVEENRTFPIKILGVGHYLPKRVVTNAEVEDIIGKPRGYIAKTKAGIKSRRWANPTTETNS